MTVLGALIALGGVSLATSASASGPGGSCQVKSATEIWTDLLNGGSFSPLKCYY